MSERSDELSDVVRNIEENMERFQRENREYVPYPRTPLQEEILKEIYDDRGTTVALITRNAYGARVLNAANVMFIDIDFDNFSSKDLSPSRNNSTGLWSLLRRLFYPAKKDGISTAENFSEEELGLQKLRNMAIQAGLNIRVYRTAAGLRGLVTSRIFDPTDKAALDLLRACGSDPCYVTLCGVQKCFRARLDPKPWRIGLPVPGVRFPFESEDEKGAMEDWVIRFDSARRHVGVCHFIEDIAGNPGEAIAQEVQPVLQFHDDACRSDTAVKLA